MTTKSAGRPARDELKGLVESGEIDTVIVAITDMQGRLQGKRLDATYFFEELTDGVVEGCSYLLALCHARKAHTCRVPSGNCPAYFGNDHFSVLDRSRRHISAEHDAASNDQ